MGMEEFAGKIAGTSTLVKNNLCQTTSGGPLGGAWLTSNVTSHTQIDYNFYAGVGTSNNFTVPSRKRKQLRGMVGYSIFL